MEMPKSGAEKIHFTPSVKNVLYIIMCCPETFKISVTPPSLPHPQERVRRYPLHHHRFSGWRRA